MMESEQRGHRLHGGAPRQLFSVLSFLIPFLALSIGFALHGVHPFGDRQILVTDFWQQYYPFLSDLWHTFREGGSLLWSWTSGLGGNALGLIAYYMASPLNLLIIPFPHAWLREVLTFLLLVKVGIAGLSMGLCIRRLAGQESWLQPAFAAFYALCAFALGYYWNIMWMDTFALLPLCMLGLHALVRDGRFILYTLALFLSVFVNFYIGYMVCLFTAMMFFLFSLMEGLSPRLLLKRLGLIALCSALAIGMTALLTLPAYRALAKSYSAVNKFPTTLKFYESIPDILGNFLAFTPPSSKEGLPNLYSGMGCLLFSGVFLASGQIRLREKLGYLGACAFLILSCNLNALNYIWHGFHFTNMIPYRFSFLVSFLVVLMGARGFDLLSSMGKKAPLAMAIPGAVFLCLAVLGVQEGKYILMNAALCAVYLVLCALMAFIPKGRKAFMGLLFVTLLAELSISTYLGIIAVRTTARDGYPSQMARVQSLLSLREPEESAFYRTEFARWYTTNDPALYGYQGVSLFASTINVSTTRFMLGLGLPGGEAANRYAYAETSPLTNAFLNLRYLVSRDGRHLDGGAYWDVVGEVDGGLLLENKRYLPMGFMMAEDAGAYGRELSNPFLSQNDLFRRATGLSGDIFTLMDMTNVGHQGYAVTRHSLGNYRFDREEETAEEGRLKWNYTPPADGPLYAYVKIDGVDTVEIWVDDALFTTVEVKRPFLFCAGNFQAGRKVSIVSKPGQDGGNAIIYVANLDHALFDAGYALLSDEPLTLTDFGDTGFTGTVHAKADGLLYVSLPYERGWEALVDGEKQDILPLDGAMATLPLSAGTHEITFRYRGDGLALGGLISLISFLGFGGAVLLYQKKRRGKANDGKAS